MDGSEGWPGMPSEEHGRDLLDIAITGGYGAFLAVVFKAVFVARRGADGKPFTWRQAMIELFGAGAVGAITAWALESFSINRELSSVIIAMSGYVGGPLLDMMYREMQETLQAAFDGLQKWLSEGKWDKR